MLFRPYSLQQNNKSTITLSPKAPKKPTYLRFKPDRDSNYKAARSLCSIQTNRKSGSLTNRRMLSHRKLISVSSLENRQNLTDRRPIEDIQREKKTTIQNQNNLRLASIEKQERSSSNKKRFYFSKLARNQRIRTIQNDGPDNIGKVLQIKQNILKEFIDRFQEELREISQKKSTHQTLSTHRNQNLSKIKISNTFRLKTQNTKEQTTKKPRNLITSLQSNQSTLNLTKSGNQKQNIQVPRTEDDKNNFGEYIRQLKQHKKKDQKIFILKNHKKSLQNITISKIGQTQHVTSRISKIQTKNKLNLKELFRHSKKYEPYLKDTATLVVRKIDEIQEKQSKLQKSSLMISPVKQKQKVQKKLVNQVDCSAIEQINQSSFLSQMGRKSLLKHLQNQSAKIVKEQQRKTKKCLAKMKSIFPSDFF